MLTSSEASFGRPVYTGAPTGVTMQGVGHSPGLIARTYPARTFAPGLFLSLFREHNNT